MEKVKTIELRKLIDDETGDMLLEIRDSFTDAGLWQPATKLDIDYRLEQIADKMSDLRDEYRKLVSYRPNVKDFEFGKDICPECVKSGNKGILKTHLIMCDGEFLKNPTLVETSYCYACNHKGCNNPEEVTYGQ